MLLLFSSLSHSYANRLITIAQTRPVIPIMVSIMVQDFKVVFSSISRRELISHSAVLKHPADNSAASNYQ